MRLSNNNNVHIPNFYGRIARSNDRAKQHTKRSKLKRGVCLCGYHITDQLRPKPKRENFLLTKKKNYISKCLKNTLQKGKRN